MGADGHIVICKRADFETANPNVVPRWLGLYEGEFLGIDCCWGYFGDNLFEPNYLTPWSGDTFHINRIYEDGQLSRFDPSREAGDQGRISLVHRPR